MAETKVTELKYYGVRVRAISALRRSGFETIESVVTRYDSLMIDVYGLGPMMLSEIHDGIEAWAAGQDRFEFDRYYAPKILWKDVPVERRITKSHIEGRAKSDVVYYDQAWLDRRIRSLTTPECHAAVHWYYNTPTPLAPCSHPPTPGEFFCVVHGGKKKDSVTMRDRVLSPVVMRRIACQVDPVLVP